MGDRGGDRARILRAIDAISSSTALVALSPVLAVVGLAVKLSSTGPVFVHLVRQGRDGRLVTVVSFRTTVAGRDGEQLTAVGRLLRHGALDELPQLWNVVRGNLTLCELLLARRATQPSS